MWIYIWSHRANRSGRENMSQDSEKKRKGNLRASWIRYPFKILKKNGFLNKYRSLFRWWVFWTCSGPKQRTEIVLEQREKGSVALNDIIDVSKVNLGLYYQTNYFHDSFKTSGFGFDSVSQSIYLLLVNENIAFICFTAQFQASISRSYVIVQKKLASHRFWLFCANYCRRMDVESFCSRLMILHCTISVHTVRRK